MPEEYADKKLASAAGLAKGIAAWVKGQQEAKLKQQAAESQMLRTMFPLLFRQQQFEQEQKQAWNIFATQEARAREENEYAKTQDTMEWMFKRLGIEREDAKLWADRYYKERELGLEERKVGIMEQAEERAGAAQEFEQETKWPKEVEMEESKISASLEQIKVDLAKITSAERMAGLDRTLQMELTRLKNNLELTLAGYQNVRADAALKSKESTDVLDGLMRALADAEDRVWAWQGALADKATGTEGATNARALQDAIRNRQTIIDSINYTRSQLGQPPMSTEELNVIKEQRRLRKDVWQVVPTPKAAAPSTAEPVSMEEINAIKAMDEDAKNAAYAALYPRLKAMGKSEADIAKIEKYLGIK